MDDRQQLNSLYVVMHVRLRVTTLAVLVQLGGSVDWMGHTSPRDELWGWVQADASGGCLPCTTSVGRFPGLVGGLWVSAAATGCLSPPWQRISEYSVPGQYQHPHYMPDGWHASFVAAQAVLPPVVPALNGEFGGALTLQSIVVMQARSLTAHTGSWRPSAARALRLAARRPKHLCVCASFIARWSLDVK